MTPRSRQGRGKHGNQKGGARAGAGRPKTNGEGYVELGVRLGPEQIARARQLATELGVKPAEVFRRALYGRAQIGPGSEPYRRRTLLLLPETREALRSIAGSGDVAVVVRGIFSGEIAHL